MSFKVPPSYFNQFNDILKDKMIEEEAFSWNDYPLLNSIPKQESYTVPDDYSFSKNSTLSSPKNNRTYVNLGVLFLVLIFVSTAGYFLLKKKDLSQNQFADIELFEEISYLETWESNDGIVEELLSIEADYLELDIDESNIDIYLEMIEEDFDLTDLNLIIEL